MHLQVSNPLRKNLLAPCHDNNRSLRYLNNMICLHRCRVACLTLTIACTPSPSSQTGTISVHRIRQITFVDSLPYDNEMVEGYLQRVAVEHDRGIDTIENSATHYQPIIQGDSIVYGLRYDEDRVIGAFVYRVQTRTTKELSIPEDLFAYGHPELSPDGKHLAYLSRMGDNGGRFNIVAWPQRTPVFRGQPIQLLETDAGVDHIEWLDAKRFTALIDLTYTVGGTERTRGHLDSLGGVTIDTLRSSDVPR